MIRPSEIVDRVYEKRGGIAPTVNGQVLLEAIVLDVLDVLAEEGLIELEEVTP